MDRVGVPVAGAVEIETAGQHEILDMDRKRVADPRHDRVVTFGRVLHDRVAEIVDDVGVVAVADPRIVSAPERPSNVLSQTLPTSVLSSPFPVPSASALPIRVRFSTLALSV